MNSGRGLRLVYLVGVVAGFVGIAVSLTVLRPDADLFVQVITTGGIFGLLGLLGGLLRPAGGFHWGIALAIPVFVLLAVSVGFAGEVGIFLARDLPVLLAVAVFGILGGVAGAAARAKRTRAV